MRLTINKISNYWHLLIHANLKIKKVFANVGNLIIVDFSTNSIKVHLLSLITKN